MFKNRSLQLKMVKENPTTSNAAHSSEKLNWSPEQISKIAKDQVRNLAVVVAGVYAVKVALDTTSEIAINAAPKR